MNARRVDLAVAAAILVYGAVLLRLSQTITVEYWDGLLGMLNALALKGGGSRAFPLVVDLGRPPLDTAFLAAPVLLGSRLGGAWAALRLTHALMACVPVLLAAVCYSLLRRRAPAETAAFGAALVALNPMLIRHSAFALFDAASALTVLPFLALSWRWLERPTRGRWAAACAAYGFAVAARYQLCVFLAAPAAAWLFQRRAWRRDGLPVWLGLAAMPPLGLALTGVVGAALWSAGMRLSFFQGLREAASTFERVFVFDTVGKHSTDVLIYARSLALQLGAGASLLALFGARRWVLRRSLGGVFLAASLFVPLAVLSAGVGNKEERFSLMFLPLAAAAVCEGLEACRESWGRRGWIAAALAAAVGFPWNVEASMWRFLASEPSVHASLPWELARALQPSGPDTCALWEADTLWLAPRQPIVGAEQMPPIGDVPMRYFTGRDVVSLDQAAQEGCLPDARVVAGVPPDLLYVERADPDPDADVLTWRRTAVVGPDWTVTPVAPVAQRRMN